MKKELSTSEAVNELMSDEYAGWSYNGAIALVEYLEDLEEDLGESIEFNTIALRCEFTEYKNFKEIAKQYGVYGADDTEDELRDYFKDRTTVIEFDGGVIIANY